MKYLKLGLISLVAFFLLLFLMSLLIPGRIRVSRAINIAAPAHRIHHMIADTSNWHLWNEMNIKQISVTMENVTPKLIESEWQYAGRQIEGVFRLEESAGVTVVQWYFDFRLRWYPWEKFGSITFDKQFGFPMERSLNNLKKAIENSP